MLTRTRTIIACAAAAIALGSGGTAALATTTTTTTWTVAPGGAFSGTLPTGKLITFKDVTTNGGVSCSVSSLSGSLKSGSGLSGRGIGAITGVSQPGHCSATMSIAFGRNPGLRAISYNATTGVTSGRLTLLHISFSVTSPVNCSLVVDGTSDTADNGYVPFKYNNATHVVKTIVGGSLHIYDSNCPNLNNGDKAAFTSTYKLSPGQTITSP
jgi:hypothetical protein